MSDTRKRLEQALDAFIRTGQIDPTYFTDDFELHQASSIIDTAGVFRGRGAAREALRELRGSFEGLVFEPEEFIEAPGGEVVVFIRVSGRGRGSMVEIDNRIAWVLTYREDAIARMVIYEERREALEALGLDAASS